jgi:Tfp pilus assembly protein PilN
MNMPGLIAGRLNLLTAAQQGSGWRYTRYVALRRKGRVRIARRERDFIPADHSKKNGRHPWILIVHGAGIVSKRWDEKDPSVRRIADRPAEFLSVVEAGANIVFMRRELYDSLTTTLAGAGVSAIVARISASGPIEEEVRAAAAEYFDETLSLKNLLRPTQESHRVLSLATRRLMLPVLAVILLLLAGNFAVQRRWQQTLEQQRGELAALESAAEGRNSRRQGQKSLEALLLPSPALPYAYLADRVAGGVPAGITLTTLDIHPLTKKIQSGQPLAVSAGRLLIGGRSAAMPPVTAFTDTLRRLPFTRSLQLLSMDKGRAGDYVFQIEIGL